MSVDDLRQALELLASWEQVPQVHLTGGEPFLFFDLLLAGTRMAADLGITVYVETSAAWCVDEERVQERFAALKEAGLAAVLISCSPFHAERIPPARTLQAVRSALGVFGPRGVMVYQSEFLSLIQKFGLEKPTSLDIYEANFGLDVAGQILWGGYGLIAGGRAGYKLGHLLECKPAETFADENCAGAILLAHHSHMDLYGNYIPAFCGGLAAADWRYEAPLQRPYPELLEMLVAHGPYALFKLATQRYDYRPLPAGYAGKCHLCVDVRWHLVNVKPDDYPELRPLEFYENI